MQKKIVAICTLKDELVLKYNEYLEYLPLSNEETDKSWSELIAHYKPKVIIFGLQTIDEMKLSLWRQQQPDDELKFIRKGTSLHRVDFAAAKIHKIDVLNIPGVNAPFVAEFISQLILLKPMDNSLTGIVGVGDIGKIVTTKLIEAHKKVLLYNRSHHAFKDTNYTYVNDLKEIFTKAMNIAICLPLTIETKGIITEQHIRGMPRNGQIICVSPPRIMSTGAIIALHERKDLTAIFDHVASGLNFIHEALGHTNLRRNFIFEEKAAFSYECQYAMGNAAIIMALSNDNR